MLAGMLAPISLAALSGVMPPGQPHVIPTRSIGQPPSQPTPAQPCAPDPATGAPARLLPRGSLLDLTV